MVPIEVAVLKVKRFAKLTRILFTIECGKVDFTYSLSLPKDYDERIAEAANRHRMIESTWLRLQQLMIPNHSRYAMDGGVRPPPFCESALLGLHHLLCYRQKRMVQTAVFVLRRLPQYRGYPDG